jgi:hypothetical protein
MLHSELELALYQTPSGRSKRTGTKFRFAKAKLLMRKSRLNWYIKEVTVETLVASGSGVGRNAMAVGSACD